MHLITLIVWIVSLVLLFFKPYSTGRDWASLGLFFFDLWIGLHFLIVASDPITL